MSGLLDVLAGNAVAAAAVALVALATQRWLRPRPAVLHALWAVVLLRLVAPPLWPVGIVPRPDVPEPLLQAVRSGSALADAGLHSVWNPWHAALVATAGPAHGTATRSLDVPPSTSTQVAPNPAPVPVGRDDRAAPLGTRIAPSRDVRLAATGPGPESPPDAEARPAPAAEPSRAPERPARRGVDAATSLPRPAHAARYGLADPGSLAAAAALPAGDARESASPDAATASVASALSLAPGLSLAESLSLLIAFGALAVLALGVWRSRLFRHVLAGGRRAPHALRQRGERLAAEVGLARCPEIWLVPARVPPMLWLGRTRPRILLPEELLASLSPEQTDALLVHELAHVRRRDHWVRLLELAATAAFWWYPLAWWARARLREVEERCCDEWVARVLPRSGRAYAEGLLKTLAFLSADDRPLPAAATGARPLRDIESRLKEILMSRPAPRLAGHARTALFAVATVGLAVFPTWAQRAAGPHDSPEEEPAAETRVEDAARPETEDAVASDATAEPESPKPRRGFGTAPSAPPPVPPSPPVAPVAGVAPALPAPPSPRVAPAPGVAPVAAAPPVAPAPVTRPLPALVPVAPRAPVAPRRPDLDRSVRVVVRTPSGTRPATGDEPADVDVDGLSDRDVTVYIDDDEPMDPALAAAQRKIEQQRLGIERQRLELEQQQRELERQQLELAARHMEKQAEAEQARLQATAESLRAHGQADAVQRVQAQLDQARRQMDVQRRRMSLEADQLERVGKLEAEIQRRQLDAEQAEIAGHEAQADEIRAAAEKLEAELERVQFDVETKQGELESEMMAAQLAAERLEMELERHDRGEAMQRLAREIERHAAERQRELAARQAELQARAVERQARVKEREADRAEAEGREAEARSLRDAAEALQRQAEEHLRVAEQQRRDAEAADLQAELTDQLAELEVARADGDPEQVADLENEIARLRQRIDEQDRDAVEE